MNEMMNQSYSKAGFYSESLGRYTAKTFGWMFAGLMVTFIVAVSLFMTRAILYVYSIPYWYYLLLIAEVATVIVLSSRVEKMSVGAARGLFFLYAALNGVVFCAYLILFNLSVLWMVFGITSLFFGIMALIGWFGNINFAGLRPLMMGGLLFLILKDIVQKRRYRMEEIGLSGMLFVIVSALSYGFTTTGVDNAAHVGGLIAGFLLTGILTIRK